MRIGVIGANGFIGRNLCQVLLENESNSVYRWTRPLNGNFLMEQDRERYLRMNFDLVFQLAWTNVEDLTYRNHRLNESYAIASSQFALSCHVKGIKSVLLGSTITDDSLASDNYVESKRLLDRRIRELSSPFVSLVKPPVVFSIRDRRPHLIRQFVSWIEEGNSADSFVPLTPSAVIEVIEVRDLARALLQIGKSKMRSGVFTVTSGLHVTVSEFVKQLRRQIDGCPAECLPSVTVKESTTMSDSFLIYSNKDTLAFFSKTSILPPN